MGRTIGSSVGERWQGARWISHARRARGVLDGSSVAEHIQKKAPRAHVVKAFNYAFASRMANPRSNGTQLDGFVAGDDEAAKQKTLEFAESIGFRPIDAGPLSMARALEGMGLLHILLQIKHNWPWQSGWKLAGPTSTTRSNAAPPLRRLRTQLPMTAVCTSVSPC